MFYLLNFLVIEHLAGVSRVKNREEENASEKGQYEILSPPLKIPCFNPVFFLLKRIWKTKKIFFWQGLGTRTREGMRKGMRAKEREKGNARKATRERGEKGNARKRTREKEDEKK